MKQQLTLKTEQKQIQKLSLEMLQQLDLLALPADELEKRVELELQENPLLERKEGEKRSGFSTGSFDGYGKAKKKSLKEWLIEQVSLTENNPKHQKLMVHFIDYINEDGYLTDTSEDHLLSFLPEDLYDELLYKLQHLDPAGIFARSLSECLTLQVRRRGWDLDLIHLLVQEDLETIASGRIEELSKKYDISETSIQKELQKLYSLDPKPGLQYSPEEPSDYVVPDIILTKKEQGFDIQLNERSYPELLISDIYDHVHEEEAKEYIKERKTRARFIIDALERRRVTILKVMEVLLRVHESFFLKDVPRTFLTRQMIAEELDLHNSTVSRAVQNKYLLYNNRLYSLDSFFPKGVKTSEGTQISSDMVKSIIRRLIQNENKKKPFSDQKLSELLEDMGILIARRTVSKYRDEMKILQSSYRRM